MPFGFNEAEYFVVDGLFDGVTVDANYLVPHLQIHDVTFSV